MNIEFSTLSKLRAEPVSSATAIAVKSTNTPGARSLRLNKISLFLKAVLTASVLTSSMQAFAIPVVGSLPEGVVVELGSVTTVTQDGASNQVSLIDWSSFNIDAGETVNFNQPGSLAIVVNRILSTGQETQILGDINANGNIFLVNPNGFLFGDAANVNVGGLVVSTLNMDSSATSMMAGNDVVLSGGSTAGGIINNGTLQATNGVSLIGNYVDNQGNISVTGAAATLNLTAADAATLSFDSSGLLQFQVTTTSGLSDEFNDDVAAAIENAGSLTAAGENAGVFISVDALDDVYASAINHTGIVEATDFTVNASGNVVLTNSQNSLEIDRKMDMMANALTFDRLITGGGEDSSISLTTTGAEQGIQVNTLIANDINIDTQGDFTQVDQNAGMVGESLNIQARNVTLQNAASISGEININAEQNVALETSLSVEREIELQGASVTLQSLDITGDNGTVTITTTDSSTGLSLTDIDSENILVNAAGSVSQAEATVLTAQDINISGLNVDISSLSEGVNELTLTAQDQLQFEQNINSVGNMSLTAASMQLSELATTSADQSDSITINTTDALNAVTLGNNITTSQLTIQAAGDINHVITGQLIAEDASFFGANIDLGDLSGVTNSITVSASDSLVLQDGINVAESINLSANSLTLQSLTGLEQITLVNNGTADLLLPELTSSTISVSSGAGITQSGESVITANVSGFSANSFVALNNVNNSFGQLSISAQSATVQNASELVLDNVVLDQFLLILGTGALSQSATGQLNVSDLAISSPGNVVLSNNNNSIDSLAVSASNLNITNSENLIIDSLQVNDFSAVITGDLSQSANSLVQVGGVANINAVDGSITLNKTDNDFNVVAVTADSTFIADTNGLVLSDVTSDFFSVSAQSTVTQANNSVLQVGELVADVASGELRLNGANNDFGTVSVSANANNGDVVLSDISGVILGDIVSSGLTVVSAGNVSQANNTSVNSGQLTIASEGADVNLSGSGNNIAVADIQAEQLTFTNQRDLQFTFSGGDVSLTNSGNVNFGNVSSREFSTNISGSITQNSDNGFSAANANIIATGDMSFGTVDTSGSLNLQLSGTLVGTTLRGDGIDVTAQSVDVGSINSIGQGELSISATNSLVVGVLNANAIALDAASITLNEVVASGGNDLVLATSSGSLSIGTITADEGSNVSLSSESGDVTLTDINAFEDVTVATGGNITQSAGLLSGGTIDISGTGGVLLNNVQATDAIALNSAGSIQTGNLSSSVVNVNAGGSFASNDITSGSVSVTSSQMQIESIDSTGSVVLAATNGVLSVGEIGVQNGVEGTQISLNSTGNLNVGDITATQFENSSVSSVLTSSAGGVTLGNVDVNGGLTIDAGVSLDTGNLVAQNASLSSAGNITLAGLQIASGLLELQGVEVIGTDDGTVFSASASENNSLNIVAEGALLNLSGMNAANTGVTALANSGDINLNNITSAGLLDITSVFDGSINLQNLDVASLTLSTRGAITQGEGSVVATNLVINQADQVDLSHSENDFTTVSLNNAGTGDTGNVQLVDSNGIALNGVSGGTIGISTDGTMTVNEGTAVTANTIDLRANQLALNTQAGNSNISAQTISLISNTTIQADILGASNTADITLVAGGGANFENDVDAINANIQTINVATTQADNVTVAIADNVTANLGTELPNAGLAQNVDNGFRVTASAISLEPLAVFDASTLPVAENLTPQAQATFGTQRAQAETEQGNVETDTVISGSIFNEEESLIKLPEGEESNSDLENDFAFEGEDINYLSPFDRSHTTTEIIGSGR